MGRIKDRNVSLYISTERYERWMRYAKGKDMSMSAFVRYCVETYISSVERFRKKAEERV